MCFADSKPSLEMVLYDPAAAESSSSAAPGAPHAGIVLDVAPISSAPPLQLRPPPAAGREEPPCLRRHLLVALGLRADLPVHFIHDKCVTSSDLEPHQNRFRIPRDGVDRQLVPILTLEEIVAANLNNNKDKDPSPVNKDKDPSPVPTKRARKQQHQQPGPSEPPPPQQPGPSEPPQQNGAADAQEEQLPPTKKMKKPKKKGEVHGGLPVKLVDLRAGAKELLMSKWRSSKGTVVKGEGYLPFIRKCSFKEGDNVEIWAFVQRRFHLFGKDLCDDSLLHILVVKKQDEPMHCCYCCAPAHVPPPITRYASATGSQDQQLMNPSIGIRDGGE